MTDVVVRRVPFHGDEIVAVQGPDGVFVAVKPICERFGLAWPPQYRKLSDPKNDWGVTQTVIPSAGGTQETVVLALLDVPLWLATIHPAKVAEAHRERLVLYRREAKRVLFEHFFGARGELAHLRDQLERCSGFLQAFRPSWGRIAALQRAKVERSMVYHFVSMSFTETLAQIEEMEAIGVIDLEAWFEHDAPTSARIQSRAPGFPADRFSDEG